MEPPVRLFTFRVLAFMEIVLMDDPTNVEYVNALVKRVLIDPDTPRRDCAFTVDTMSVLVLITQSSNVLLIMLVAINEDTVIVEPTRVLNCPAFILTFVPFMVETVMVEFTVPELTVKEPPTAVWYDRFVVETLSELKLTALTEDVVSVE